MAFWLHLMPKLHRRDNSEPVFHAPEDDNSTARIAVPDDVTMTTQVTKETASVTKPGLRRSSEDGYAWTSSGADETETNVDDGLLVDSASVAVAASGPGSRMLMVTLGVGGTLLLINCVVFVSMLCHRLRRFKTFTTTDSVKPITYVRLSRVHYRFVLSTPHTISE